MDPGFQLGGAALLPYATRAAGMTIRAGGDGQQRDALTDQIAAAA